MQAKLLRIEVHSGEAGLWHAKSQDLPAFRITDISREGVVEDITVVLEAFHTLNDQPVKAFQIEPEHADDFRWVIIPTQQVRDAIAKADAEPHHEPIAS
jgi:hypothetical protein